MGSAIGTWSENRIRFYAIAMMCASVFLWAAIETIGSYIPAAYSPYQTVWALYATHLLFMMAVLGPRYQTKLVYTKRLGMQLLRSLLMLGMPVFFILAAQRMPLKDVLSIFWVSPMMVIAFSALLGERVSLTYWAAVIGGFAGVLIVSRPDGGVLQLAVLPLGMALCFSLYQVMTRMMRAEDTLPSLFYTAGGVFVLLSFGMPSFWQTPTLESALLMVSIGLVGFLGLFTLDKACEMAPASIVAPFAYTQPIWIIILSYLASGQFPGRLAILGVLTIIVSGLYLLLRGTVLQSSDIRLRTSAH
jgi:drug/metabolite transporter (DMT)-like permease